MPHRGFVKNKKGGAISPKIRDGFPQKGMSPNFGDALFQQKAMSMTFGDAFSRQSAMSPIAN